MRETGDQFSQKVLRVRGRTWARWKAKRIVRALGYVRSHENAPVIFQTQGKVLFFRKYSDGNISG